MGNKLGDKIISKKPHACGGNLWEVVRVGADVKIKCEKCGHIVMFDIEAFKKIVKTKVE